MNKHSSPKLKTANNQIVFNQLQQDMTKNMSQMQQNIITQQQNMAKVNSVYQGVFDGLSKNNIELNPMQFEVLHNYVAKTVDGEYQKYLSSRMNNS